MKIYASGCPLCGADNSSWSLWGQLGHATVAHSWHQRLRLFWHTRTPLAQLLINRKFGARRP